MSDTFDPVTMAGPALRFLLTNLDCDGGCLPRFHTILDRGVIHRHANWDFGDLSGRYVDGMILLRTITGSGEQLDRERSLRRRWLSTFQDGAGLTFREQTGFSDSEADVFDQSSSLIALVTWYLHSCDARLARMIDRMVERLLALAVHEGDSCRFAFPTYLPDGSEGPHRDNWESADPAHHGGRLLIGLARYYEATGSEPARRLTACLSRNVARTSGLFDPDREAAFTGHMHSRTATLAGLLRFAYATDDAELAELVRRVYEYAKGVGTSFGWFPEIVDPDNPENPRTRLSEGEITADMIQIALLLARRDPSYFEDVERFSRNHFRESQLRAVPRSVARGEGGPEAIGAFAGFSRPNDWGNRTMNCCAGGAARGIYFLWESAIAACGDGVCVNLLFDGERHGIRVDSHLPRRGALDISALTAVSLKVRIPSWVAPGEVAVSLPEGRGFGIADGYLAFRLARGETASVIFPVPRRVELIGTPAGRYVVQWTGYTVTRMDPQGSFIPFYQGRDPDLETPTVIKRYFHPASAVAW